MDAAADRRTPRIVSIERAVSTPRIEVLLEDRREIRRQRRVLDDYDPSARTREGRRRERGDAPVLRGQDDRAVVHDPVLRVAEPVSLLDVQGRVAGEEVDLRAGGEVLDDVPLLLVD